MSKAAAFISFAQNSVMMRFACLFFFILVHATGFSQQSYPEGFAEEIVFDEFSFPAGMVHTDSSYAFVWELDGKVWMIKDGVIHPEPIIDITEEVGFWTDHGLLSVAIDPDFFNNGYIYLLYAVDRHHLFKFGTPDYDPEFSETNTASIGRITRYTLNQVDFQFVIPGSRHILVGESHNNGIPLAASSHGVGTIVFGADNSLLVSTGDGSTYIPNEDGLGYNGEGAVPAEAWDSLALADGTLTAEEFLGSYRSQYLNGLNGKILRIDPQTGEGIPNNPFYDQANPGSPISKVWSLGLRNPYRITIKPETGDENNPGTIYMTDVGDWVWEEINVAREGGLNFGWPIYQGPSQHYFYNESITQNTSAPNPLGGSSECPDAFFNYREVIVQPNSAHNYAYPNPCNPEIQIPTDITTFVHERPVMSYNNFVSGELSVVSTYNSLGEASYVSVEEETSGVEGTNFGGISGSGGIFLTGDFIPQEYQNWYITGDYSGWLRAFKFDQYDELKSMELWNSSIGAPIHISQDPKDGCIYVVSIFPAEIKRICFGGNLKPIVDVTPEEVYGTSPISAKFDASSSYDPEGTDISYEWKLENGDTFDGAIFNHLFTAPTNEITTEYLQLKVTDEEGLADSTQILISLNNTPPDATISSIEPDQLLPLGIPSNLSLIADVVDLEHSENELDFSWEIFLKHNTHEHRLDILSENNSAFTFGPLTCGEHEVYWYEVTLEVTDPGGLKDFDRVELFPDCENELDDTWQFGLKELVIAPNPATNNITLLFKSNISGKSNFEIFDLTGKKVFYEERIELNDIKCHQIDISSLATGIYILQSTVGGKSYQDKFLKVLD